MSHQALRKIRKEVAEGRVSERTKGKLSIFKYTNDTTYDKSWNETNIRCRGIIFNIEKGSVLCRPFDKFFNVGERTATSSKVLAAMAEHMSFDVQEKLDGSLLNVWYFEGKWHCSTGGSLDNEHTHYAEKHLLSLYDFNHIPHNLTYCFEFVAPWDRKVVDYGGQNKMVLLSVFENKWESIEVQPSRVDAFAKRLGCYRPKIYHIDKNIWNDNNFLSNFNIPQGEEGFVIRFDSGFRVKLKSLWYMKIHRLLSKVRVKYVWELMVNKDYGGFIYEEDIPPDVKKQFDDLYATIKQTRDTIEYEIEEEWEKIVQAVGDFEGEERERFKTYAEQIVKVLDVDIRPVLFARMKKRHRMEDDIVWKIVLKRLEEEDDGRSKSQDSSH